MPLDCTWGTVTHLFFGPSLLEIENALFLTYGLTRVFDLNKWARLPQGPRMRPPAPHFPSYRRALDFTRDQGALISPPLPDEKRRGSEREMHLHLVWSSPSDFVLPASSLWASRFPWISMHILDLNKETPKLHSEDSSASHTIEGLRR